MTTSVNKTRLLKELEQFQNDPPFGIKCSLKNDDNLNDWLAVIDGPSGTPYENGQFHLKIKIPGRYPFEPPACQFQTPIYHCNIDKAGRICLDVLKLPPQGSWKPSINLRTMLLSIQVMMQDPNPDDPLLDDLAAEFKNEYPKYLENAIKYTTKYAVPITETSLDHSVATDLREETNLKREIDIDNENVVVDENVDCKILKSSQKNSKFSKLAKKNR